MGLVSIFYIFFIWLIGTYPRRNRLLDEIPIVALSCGKTADMQTTFTLRPTMFVALTALAIGALTAAQPLSANEKTALVTARTTNKHGTAQDSHARLLPRELRVPGGVAIIAVGSSEAAKPTVTFNQSNVWVAKRGNEWVAVVGIPLSATPGEQHVTVSRGGEFSTLRFDVKPKRYAEQRLTLNRDMVEPPPDVQARIERESAHLKAVRSTWTELTHATRAEFVLPTQGPLSSRFGLQRILNGKPRSPHAGLDVAAPMGAPINAPGDGVVLDTGDYYYCGKTVFIDHGQGLITLYCHLSEILVNKGDVLKQGDRIGLVGSTGRSTGPHLHWTVYLNAVAVEPELFIPPKASTTAGAATKHKKPRE